MISTPLPDLEIGAAIHPGRKRSDEPNQDAILVIPPENGHPPLFMVADGMGGHAGGAEASRLVVEAVASRYRQAGSIEDLPDLLQQCLQNAFDSMEKYAAGRPELSSMGSTAVLVVPKGGQVVIVNVGDSRAYRLRYASSPVQPASRRSSLFNWFRREKQIVKDQEPSVEILQISYDHSVVADLVRAGQLTPLQALHSPLRNRLTQSITPRRPGVKPYINQVQFEEGDTLLLCTDGVWGVVPEAALAAIALELPPQAAADKLVQQAVSYGGPDNISVIVARRMGGQTRSLKEDDTRPRH
jgi:PPM family protein phosphatase